jgi:hypothetical protein
MIEDINYDIPDRKVWSTFSIDRFRTLVQPYKYFRASVKSHKAETNVYKLDLYDMENIGLSFGKILKNEGLATEKHRKN